MNTPIRILEGECEEEILEVLPNSTEKERYENIMQLVGRHDKKIILNSLERMYEGYLSGISSGEISSENSLSVYDIYKQLRRIFL